MRGCHQSVFVGTFRAKAEPVAEIAPDVPFLNYMYDERFQDYRYYYNGDFMNQAGREKFMPVLWHDIQEAAGEAKS